MNQKFKISFAIMLLMLCAEQTIAQNYVPTYLLDSPDDFISTNFDVFDSSGWFEKKENATVNFLNFLPNNKQSFGMGSDDNFVLTRTTDDDLPFMELDKKMTHHRYNQTYKGVMVEYAELFLHHKDGEIKYVNCKLAENLNLSVVPSISESQARTYATNHLGNTLTYTWEDSAWEADYKDLKKDTNATTFKLGELVIAKEHADSDYNTYEFKLAW